MRAVVDTNVLISGLIDKASPPAKVVDAWVARKFQPAVSGEIVEEYSVVLTREKFSSLGTVEERLNLLSMLLSFEHVALVSPEEKINAIQDDPQDNIFLECAVAGRCELIVSGDRHLLQLKSYKDTKIMTAVEFALALETRP